MAWERLRTDYEDAVFDGLRKYREVVNGDGTVSFEDKTQYTVRENAFLGAKDINAMNVAMNLIMDALNGGTDLYDVFTEYFAGQQALFEEGIGLFKAGQEAEFSAWLNEMKNKLSENAAGNLQNQIDNIGRAASVGWADGKTIVVENGKMRADEPYVNRPAATTEYYLYNYTKPGFYAFNIFPGVSTEPRDAPSGVSRTDFGLEVIPYNGDGSNENGRVMQKLFSAGKIYLRVLRTAEVAPGYTPPDWVLVNPDTMAVPLESSVQSGTHLDAFKGKAIINATAPAGFTMLSRLKSTKGAFVEGVYDGRYILEYMDDAAIRAGSNKTDTVAILLDEEGNTTFPGNVTAKEFRGTANTAFLLNANSGAKDANTAVVDRSLKAEEYTAAGSANLPSEDDYIVLTAGGKTNASGMQLAVRESDGGIATRGRHGGEWKKWNMAKGGTQLFDGRADVGGGAQALLGDITQYNMVSFTCSFSDSFCHGTMALAYATGINHIIPMGNGHITVKSDTARQIEVLENTTGYPLRQVWGYKV